MRTPVYKTIYLYLTHACNAGCSFCYRRGLFERNKRETLGPAFMTEEMAFRILDFAFSKLELHEKFSIYFWGGEPLLNMKVIQAVVERYPQFLFHTNTSGKPVTEEMYKWFMAHRNMGITWSLGNAYEKYGGLREKVAAEPWAFRLVKDNPANTVNFMVTRYDRFIEDFDLSLIHI